MAYFTQFISEGCQTSTISPYHNNTDGSSHENIRWAIRIINFYCLNEGQGGIRALLQYNYIVIMPLFHLAYLEDGFLCYFLGLF